MKTVTRMRLFHDVPMRTARSANGSLDDPRAARAWLYRIGTTVNVLFDR
jgi:hypothetical protein